jgi:hypothetical protein
VPRSVRPVRSARPVPSTRSLRSLRVVATGHSGRRSAPPDDRGQATAEYGLVILAAGAIALGVIAWANGTGSFTDLFESVVDNLTASL